MSDVEKNDPPTANDVAFNEVLGEYFRRVGRGEEVDRAAFLREHSALARQLQEHWDADCVIRSYTNSPDDSDPSVPVEIPPLDAIRHFGDYELIEELGRGGMGIVYLARHTKHDRLFAVKMMLAGEHAADVDVQRFTREATAAAKLKHPNIIAIHEVSEHKGCHYIAMEYAEGGSLSERLKAGPLPAEQAAKLVATLSEAIQFAHDGGVIHRDVKPANVLFDDEGKPKIGDFGLARRVDVDSDLTRTGQILGTPSYMSPEQAGGDIAAPTPAQDIYSLGATLYAALTGRPPFQAAELHETVVQVRTEPPVSPRALNPAVPIGLETVCLKCLEKDPTRRYQSAKELSDDLSRWLRQETIRARPIGRIERARRWSRRNKKKSAVMAASIFGFLALFAGFLVYQKQQTDAERQRALLQELQLVRLTYHRSSGDESWSDRVRDLEAQAAAFGHDEKLAEQVTESLDGVDARLHRRFPSAAAQIAFDSTGKRLIIAGGSDQSGQIDTAKIHDVESDVTVNLNHAAHGPAAFTADGTPIQVVTDGVFRTVDLESGEDLVRFRVQADVGLQLPLAMNRVLATPTGDHIAALVTDSAAKRRILIFDGRTGGLLNHYDIDPTEIALSPDGRLAAAGDETGQISVYSTAGGDPLVLPATGRNRIQSLAFARDLRRRAQPTSGIAAGWLLAAGDAGGTIAVWDLASRMPLHRLTGAAYDVHAVAFAPDGATLATAGRYFIRLWDIATGRPMLDIYGSDFTLSLAFSSDGRYLATASQSAFAEGSVDVWRIQWHRGIRTFRGLTGQVSKIVLSRGSSLIAALSHSWELGVWDADTGELKHLFEVPQGISADNAAFAFSPDGRLLAFCAGEEAKLWNLLSGETINAWKLPPGYVDTLAFPDNEHALLLRLETHDNVWPTSDNPAEKHPRVSRLRRLPVNGAAELVKEIDEFNLHVLAAAAPPDGRFFVLSGISGVRTSPVHGLKAYDANGIPLHSFSIDETAEPHFRLDPHGTAVAVTVGTPPSSHVFATPRFSGVRPLSSLPYVLGPLGAQWLATGVPSHADRGVSFFEAGNNHPVAMFGVDVTKITTYGPFDAAGETVAWGDDQGTVYLADLETVHARLSALGLTP